ncbi:hypothetical protein [Candidatus Bathycorpusculum sp.]|jgi:hypothetical protein|uniref:hypothetical protein n=1 Tax=Candidatus Bathycorpusculum sp. TaxID=2994959 RepID=UPI00281E1CFE|nr:hypothetical protein [Candidatus Termitimicrobium sp.]MCL2686142.1 hypothetical protein [Candidatus Termitimicrobium sp.]
MRTQEKSHGSANRLGRREKSLLLLMLRSDEPQGKPNPIWLDVYKEFEINYNCGLSKKYQRAFQEEKKFREAIGRLTKRGFIKPMLIAQQDTAISDPRGYGYNFYSLTSPGRSRAEKLQQYQKTSSKKDNQELEETLTQLRAMGTNQVTTRQIREELWQQTRQRFANRAEFEKHWNNTKLGRMLKKHNFERTRVGKYDGRRKYILR